MGRLNQIIAVVNGKKARFQKVVSEIYHKVQKKDLFAGLVRTYRPLDEEGETHPGESKQPQYQLKSLVDEMRGVFVDMIDTVYTQDIANCTAVANISVDGTVVAESVPVTHLLYLEKQLCDLHTFVSKLPVLDEADAWKYDENRGVYITDPILTNRTKKQYQRFVKAEATDKHPAQVEVYTEDVKVGEWTTVKLSSAFPADVKKAYLDKVVALQDAVKLAREEANSVTIEQKHIGENILNFVFGSK